MTSDDVRFDRQSKHNYGAPDPVADDAQLGHNARMLLDDVSNKVFPMADNIDNHVLVIPETEHTKRLVMEGLRDYRDSYSSLGTAVAKWFRLCAREILTEGRAIYEIGYLLRKIDDKPIGFRMLPLYSQDIVRRSGELFQHIAAGSGSEEFTIKEGYRSLREQYIPLSPDRIVFFELSRAYHRSWSRILRAIKLLDRTDPTGMLMLRLQSPELANIPFDWELARVTHERAVGAATRTVGWNGRAIVSVQRGYYYMVRLLRLQRFAIQLRDKILSDLNEGLCRAGKTIGCELQVSLSGVKTEADVDAAEARLAAGNTPFAEIFPALP
jgi:hypothetical protein